MRRFLILGVTLAGLLAQGGELKVGSKVSNFTLQNLDGTPVSYDSLKGDVTVLTWISAQCPVSNAYNERMTALYNDYAKKGVKFIFLNSNSTEPASAAAAHAKENGFPFSVYKDEDNKVADMFGAQVTPEAFVMDKNGLIVYHGSIDDSKEESKVTSKVLREALDSVLAGNAVARSETKAFGCSIKRGKRAS